MALSPLTPAAQLKTNAPFPTLRQNEETGRPTVYLDPKDKILIESSAEFMNVDLLGNKYSTSNDFLLLHDLQGQPMILSIGMDKHLYLCAYVNGAVGNWQTFDISPDPKFEASVCDASKSPADNKKILIAVSGHDTADKTKTKVYHLVFDCPKLITDENGMIVGLPFQDLPWLEVGSAISTREVKTLVCEYFGGESQSQYQIVAGVSATTLEGSHYIYNPSQGQQDWILVKFPQQVETIRSCVSGNLPGIGSGYIVLFEDNTAEKNVSCLFQGDGASKKVFLNGLQSPRRLSAHVNSSGFTDILIAADNGVGFVDTSGDSLEAPPKLLLEGIAFSHALGSERVISRKESTVLIFALSTHGELFAIQGTRNNSNDSIAFVSSSLSVSIREGVRNIAGKINPLTGAFETVYVSMDNKILKHLTRDPVTFLWKEAEMIVKSDTPNKRIKTPAFVVTLTLDNGKGSPVPVGYKVLLSSAPTLVHINDRSYNLTRRPQSIPVNAFGQLHIVIPVTDSLSTAPIAINFLPDTGETKTYRIQPSQRVLHMLGSLNTGDALRNARTSDNRPLFSDADKQKHGDKFDQAAHLLSKVPLMIAATEPGGADPTAQRSDPEEITIAWENGGSSTGTGWLSNAVDAVGEGIGDVIEHLKIALKATVKVALKIFGPVVRLILKIGAKVIRYALDSVSSIVTGVTYALENLLGVDLSALRDLFALHYKKVETTQKELASIINNGLLLTSRYLHHNHSTLSNSIDTFGLLLEGYISRPYPLQKGLKNESSGSSILNNPIITNLMKFNPLAWIMEAMAEEVGDDVQIPLLNLNISGQLFASLKEQFELLLGFLKRSWNSFQAAIGQPESVMNHLYTVFKDGFWTIFDSLKAIFLTIYSVLMNSFDAICEFCRGKWRIPYMTDLWEELTNTDFTLINFISYIVAQILELGNMKSTSVLEGMKLSAVLENVSEKKMPSLLPETLTKDLEAYRGSGGGSLEEMMRETRIAQQEGAAFLAANPVTQPRFGLMATDTAQPEAHGESSMPSPSSAVRHMLAFARSGKQMTRVANVGIEGLLQGGSGGNSQNSGDRGPVSKRAQSENSLETLMEKLDKVDDAKLDSSFSLSDISVTDSLPSGKGLVPEAPSVKSLMVGTNAFGLCCRAVEQFILHNYYDEAGREVENYDGNCVELIASLGGLMLSFFADIPPILALSNLIVSVGSFTGACFAPDKDFARIASMVGPGCSAVSSVLFLVKDPSGTCPCIAWCLWGSDVAATAGSIGSELQIEPRKPRSHKNPKPEAQGGTEIEKKKKKRVVTASQDLKAKEVVNLCTKVLDEKIKDETPIRACQLLSDAINNLSNFLSLGIIQGRDYVPANEGYEGSKGIYSAKVPEATQAACRLWELNIFQVMLLTTRLWEIESALKDMDKVMEDEQWVDVY